MNPPGDRSGRRTGIHQSDPAITGRKRTDRTVLFPSPGPVQQICDRVGLFSQGRLLADLTQRSATGRTWIRIHL